MNNQNHQTLPYDLDEHLKVETPEERKELAAVWRRLGEVDISPSEKPDSEAMWAVLREHAEDSEIRPLPVRARPAARKRRRHARSAVHNRAGRRTMRWITAPALIVAAALVGVLLWQQPVRVSAPFGEMLLVTLPDGSTAQLNSGATLSWQRGFQWLPLISDQSRVVRLQGEAFFDVRHDDAALPFVVETFNARIVVLGTEFNVHADTSALETQVTLVSGRVQVEAHSPDEKNVMLNNAGQSSLIVGLKKAPDEPQSVSLERILVWRNDGFAVSDEPLPAIFSRLERRYDVRLTLHAPEAAGEPMTLYYPTRTDVETILHDICVARDLNYRSTSRGYEVFRAP